MSSAASQALFSMHVEVLELCVAALCAKEGRLDHGDSAPAGAGLEGKASPAPPFPPAHRTVEPTQRRQP
eukprot:CAMPEP_0171215216 /NCGR_PEP_ID=MMETSP0790-20130122/31554_1 /TAXON_ID=2925 /ORGANISM="Alexandrium catenella, Strain OF101" /LENGTH=68 /DNA_ID=CAMNT_0011680965 /DNA_START=42 /DNA_END=246 /DNA_ORIENTATION=+